MTSKKKILIVQNKKISIQKVNDEDYISLTDMIKSKDGDFFVTDWLRNRNTLEFLSIWEQINNPNFNYGEFAIVKSKSGLNNFKISVKEWVKKTNAKGIISKSGRYGGGTYAHKDIAFEFGTWISPTFKLYLIKEYQRLKEIENNQYNLEWSVKRIISKVNYQIHTDAIKEYIIPVSKKWSKDFEYANEADILNIVIFGYTAKEWRKANPKRAKAGNNVRDIASINELVVLSNIESLNAEMIKDGLDKKTRFSKLQKIARYQLKILNSTDFMKGLKKTSEKIYIEHNSKNKK